MVKSYTLIGWENTPNEYWYVNASYQYHNDGMIKLAQNGNSIKDRAYSYDAANRLQTAYSGVEAREFVNNTSGGTPDGPYRHSYTYDQWNNQTEANSSFWSRGGITYLDYDANNRVTTWSYDAEGNVLSRNETATFSPFEPGRYNYDAAGREIGSTQKRSTFQIEEGVGYVLTNDFVNTQKHDGDGQVVDYSVLRHLYVNTQFSTTFGGRVFLLRSTVLGGRTISEYDANGTWSTTHVFAGSERIGQVGTTVPVAGLWHNFDPVTGDLMSTIWNGSQWSWTTLDTGGANVGDSDPFPSDGSADQDGLVPEGPGGKNVQGILGAGGGRSNCVLDGIEVDCSFIRGESSVQCPDNDCGPKWNPTANSGPGALGAWEHFHAFADGFSGYMTQYGRYRYGGGGRFANSPYDEDPSRLDQTTMNVQAGTKASPEKPVDLSVLNNALTTCIPELWPWYEMTAFKPTMPPGKGAHPKDDRYNGVVTLRDKQDGTTFNVVNDPTLTSDVKMDIVKNNARGRTSPSNPWWTDAYPAGNLNPRPGDLRYPELFGAIGMNYIRVQIHELGAAMSFIRDIYHPGPGKPVLPNDLDPTHKDDGPALEDCVGKKYYQQMGLKPNLQPHVP